MEKENQIHETYRKERLQLEDQEDQLRQMQKNMQQLAETTYSNIRFRCVPLNARRILCILHKKNSDV